MELPIITNNRGDANIFRTVDQAINYMEACDVENGEYVAYDSAGRLLSLSVVKGEIIIEDGEENPDHTAELHAVAVKFMTFVLKENLSPDLTLPELIEMMLSYEESYDARRQPPFWSRWFSFLRKG